MQEHPITTASAAASIAGGFMLLILFCQIGGMPEFDLAGASAILMAVAALGVTFSFSLVGCALGIGFAMRSSDEHIRAMNEPKTLLLLAAPGFATSVAAALWWGLLPKSHIPGQFWLLPLVIGGGLATWLYLKPTKPLRENDKDADRRGGLSKWGFAVAFWIISCVWIVIAMFAWLTFWGLYPRDGDAARFLINAVAWTGWCYAANIGVARAKQNAPAAMAATGAATLVFLMTLTENWGGLSAAVVRALGQGEMPVALVLSAEGCDQLNKAAGGRPVCRVAPNEKTALVCPAVLRSRIGSPFYVELSAADERGRWPQPHPPARLSAIAIDKKEVKSWSRLAPMPAASAAGTRASDAVVSFLDAAPARSWLTEQCGAAPSPSTSSVAPAPTPAASR